MWEIICSGHLKYFLMATQFWPWSPHPTPFLFPLPTFPLLPDLSDYLGKWCQTDPHLTRADSQLVSSASWPHRIWTASLWAPSVLPASACCAISLFSPDARSHRESPWQEIEVFCAVKNHRRPCFEFFTPTSVQRCWSHSRLPDSRAGQLMRVLLDLDLWRGHPWSTVTDSLCQGLGKWEVTIISIGTEEDLFVLNVKKLFTKLTRNINKNWRGSLLLLMCLIC